ncbi:hypothetical protein ACVK1X_002955 [Pseudomonas sp. PvR086]|jgi:hypothetical protein
MQTFNPFPDRYRSIKSSVTNSNPLVIDTEANPQDILESALQRIRASSASGPPASYLKHFTAYASSTVMFRTFRTLPMRFIC